MKNKNRLKSELVFWVPALLYSGLMFFLFYNQCTRPAAYNSDMPAYAKEIFGNTEEYYEYTGYFSLFLFASKVLGLILPLEYAIPVILTSLNTFALYITYDYLRKILLDGKGKNKFGKFLEFVPALAAMTIFLVSMLYPPVQKVSELGLGTRYMGVFTPNPYHNATYLATRPFAILLFLKFICIMDGGEGNKIKDYILLCVYMLLSTFVKPSFIMAFAPIMLVAAIVSFAKKGFKLKRNDYLLMLSALPTIAALLLQYFLSFNEEKANVIRLGFGTTWMFWRENEFLSAILLANAFPFIYLVLNLRKWKESRIFRFGWYAYLSGMLSFLLLYESGDRIATASFSWGYMHGLFFAFFVSVLSLVKDLKKRISLWNGIPLGVLLLHLICGIYFFIYILQGKSFSKF